MKSAVTLATVTTEFLERPGLAPSTRETYELTLGLLLQKYGSWSIEIISKQTLVEYLNNLSHLKYTTHHKHQAILQSLLNFAVEQGYIKSNPIRGLKQRLPEREKGEHKSDETIRYLTQSQLNILYAAVKDDLRLSAIVNLLHRTGCRIGELLALNIDSVDIKNQKFQVLGKGNKQRWCYYSNDAASALAKYFKYSRHKNTDALLTAQHPVTLKVSRISYHTLHDYWRETTNKYPQLQLCRIHDLRHTFATERVGLISIEELCSLMAYREKVYTVMRSSYGGYYRRILPLILNKLEFRSNNEVHRPVIQAIALLKKYADSKQRYYDAGVDIPIDGVLRSGWQEIILETGVDDEIKVNRINYELSVLQALREKLR